MIDLTTGNARFLGLAIMALVVGGFFYGVHWFVGLWYSTNVCEVCMGPTPCYDHDQAEKERWGS